MGGRAVLVSARVLTHVDSLNYSSVSNPVSESISKPGFKSVPVHKMGQSMSHLIVVDLNRTVTLAVALTIAKVPWRDIRLA